LILLFLKAATDSSVSNPEHVDYKISLYFGIQIGGKCLRLVLEIGHLKKNYKFERVENLKYLGITLNEDNDNQIDLQERIKSTNKTCFMIQTFF
jgi:hypothetical protein